ncbi:MAG TPA: methylated-DNA--[protein]-cysteine S-methyltransferase [Candidatus Acidoferrales bacterium]|nr:methylated-DNA--[protein]-cysteine S-methyltransferase [Candidatus Acidoferrales bacterium]
MTRYSILKTSLLGDLLLVAEAAHLTGVYFLGGRHAPAVPRDWRQDPDHSVLRRTAAQLQAYLRGGRRSFSVSLACAGTDFQKEIWRQIALIPFGQTITYTELARRAGAPRAVRAAGTATGKNPFSIIVPCHRVVGKNGSLGGYAGGLKRKRRLLEIEHSHFPGTGAGNPKSKSPKFENKELVESCLPFCSS